MIRRSYIRISGLLLLTIAAVLCGVAFFLPRLLDLNAYRTEILEALQESLHRQVSFSTGAFTWHFGPTFVFEQCTVRERDGTSEFLAAEKVKIRLALLPLLEKRVELKHIELDNASISLVRNSDGTYNIDDLLKPSGDGYRVEFEHIRLRKGTIRWRDLKETGTPVSANLTNLTLTLDHLSRGRKGSIKLSCDMAAASGPPARIALHGSIKLPDLNKSLLETELNGNADVSQVEIGRFWPYFGKFVPFGNTGGRLDVNTSFKGTPREFSSKGKIRVHNPKVEWPKVFHAQLTPGLLQLDYSLKLNRQLLEISSLEASIDKFRIKGNLRIYDYSTKDPRIVANASTPVTFRYDQVRNYVPYGIIEKDTSDYIENKIKDGVFKLETGSLDGRVSQITHMELPQNHEILHIRGPVENAVLSYGPKVPAFNNIKGTIELKGKNFNLIGMSGSFGTSPFKLNGSITEYNTDKPSDYPVRMEITPHAPEVAWLAKFAGAGKLEYGNSSLLVLTGSGHHSAYRLHGEWDLKQALYSFPGAIRKPLGMPNHLAFSTIIGRAETRLTSLAYTLSPLMLSATGILKYASQPYLGFELQTNQFMLGDSLPVLTHWQSFRPRGKVQAHIKGSGNPEDFSAMDYLGNIQMNGFSFQPGEKSKPVTGINGSIAFRGNSLETSSINARYGSSPVTLKGTIRSLQNPEAEIILYSPELFLKDISQNPARQDAAIRRFNADFSLRDGLYTLKSVSGLLNSSNFNISGTYQTGQANEAVLAITSSKLELEDLKLLNTFARADERGSGSNLAAKVRLAVDSGSYGKLQFNKLNASLLQENGITYLLGVSASIFNGQLSAKGRIAPDTQQGNRYDLNFDLEKVSADSIFQVLDISRSVSGRLTVHGDLTARGGTLIDIKKSALGNLRLKMQNGTLHKFNTLSKIFSILNISQLLKFQLPDMVADGMPYNEIKGTFSVKDGIVDSKDLFISSDAINISIIGSADIVKEELNFTIGVQPLQTVDKIVNRIPVVGWLLTGKDKDFLTAYFEARGKWSDPKVSAIPVKAMGKGIINIFRRAFELPVKLFTDTGEVILGK